MNDTISHASLFVFLAAREAERKSLAAKREVTRGRILLLMNARRASKLTFICDISRAKASEGARRFAFRFAARHDRGLRASINDLGRTVRVFDTDARQERNRMLSFAKQSRYWDFLYNDNPMKESNKVLRFEIERDFFARNLIIKPNYNYKNLSIFAKNVPLLHRTSFAIYALLEKMLFPNYY